MGLEMLLTITEMRAISTLIQCNNIRFTLAMSQTSINSVSKYIDRPYDQRHFKRTQFSTGNSSTSCHNQKRKFHQIIFKQFSHCLTENNGIWEHHYINMKVFIYNPLYYFMHSRKQQEPEKHCKFSKFNGNIFPAVFCY